MDTGFIITLISIIIPAILSALTVIISAKKEIAVNEKNTELQKELKEKEYLHQIEIEQIKQQLDKENALIKSREDAFIKLTNSYEAYLINDCSNNRFALLSSALLVRSKVSLCSFETIASIDNLTKTLNSDFLYDRAKNNSTDSIRNDVLQLAQSLSKPTKSDT